MSTETLLSMHAKGRQKLLFYYANIFYESILFQRLMINKKSSHNNDTKILHTNADKNNCMWLILLKQKVNQCSLNFSLCKNIIIQVNLHKHHNL